MTTQELRECKDYKIAVEKIINYNKGFTFTIHYSAIPKAKANALSIILQDCCTANLIQSTSIGLNIHGEKVEETFKRI